MRRRTFLAAGGVLLGAATAGVVSRPSSNEELLTAAREPGDAGTASTTTEQLLSGTDHETMLYAIEAPQDGPTAMVFGGVHGDERSGIEVAHEATDWHPDAGTLVVVPETDRVAVEANEREGIDGDLNRHFPADGELRSELARGIWDAVERHEPDVVLDLHRSLGVYGLHREYVGQAVFHSPEARGAELADRLDSDAVPWYLPFHRFRAQETNESGSLLFQHAARELGASAYLFETTAFLLDHETKVETTRLATAHVLAMHGLLDGDRA
ncbi:succinylglutamate desuccinylase/aspartoacylase family protein [Natronolimnohabitans sp. A-GB9]|uniref:succinylglutamate desuccinylase/aspartoacylase family protein n=1 Tax=Natronolimnohabitans sp. A-GB9 TaxID=3069757 RepID=UPI0027B4902F|nr:succinylglutamate desuccinylase/aspartoacylase family protein [Natronolimnohabitans sp. A-GB9]MDQ2051513.1 succinylglutamate desuccinylase/aspartoacylase family protein [Natronolimnohabitans sp. A-GB9]